MTREDSERQHRYPRRPRKSSAHVLDGTTRVAVTYRGAYDRRVPHPIARLYFLFTAIFMTMNFDGLARMTGVGFGVLAARCMTGNTTVLEGVQPEGRAVVVDVTPADGLNITMFDCEGGVFDVFWSGEVVVNGTIHIGLDTTVTITGISPDTTSGSASISGSSSGKDDGHLPGMLSIPLGLNSAVVGVAPSGLSAITNESTPSFSIFFVDGGQLHIEHMAIRGGIVSNTTDNSTSRGAGIFAQQSQVSVSGCEFEDNFAVTAGGGIFANQSTLTVIDSVFRRCRAGLDVGPGDDVPGAGGGISVSMASALRTISMVGFDVLVAYVSLFEDVLR